MLVQLHVFSFNTSTEPENALLVLNRYRTEAPVNRAVLPAYVASRSLHLERVLGDVCCRP